MPEFQIRRTSPTQFRLVETPAPEAQSLQDGEVLLAIERFSFTANNLTYAATGDMLGYWKFFPPSGNDSDGWGVIPVWGFAQVIASETEEIALGERLFGYFPPASTLRIQPTRITATRLFDGAAHRAQLPPGYNSYTRVAAEPGYDSRADDLRALLWPLHITSFCLWDKLADKAWYEAQQIVILSASSKTSIGLAQALAADESAPPVIGLTSSRNLSFVKDLGCYAQSVSYDDLASINTTLPSVIVDMSGNAELLAQLRAALGENMRYCINVGLTHWQQAQAAAAVDKSLSEFFFAPSHIQQRMQDWGAETFASKSGAFLQQSIARSRDWLHTRELDGLTGLSGVYADVCQGRIAADTGLIVNMRVMAS